MKIKTTKARKTAKVKTAKARKLFEVGEQKNTNEKTKKSNLFVQKGYPIKSTKRTPDNTWEVTVVLTRDKMRSVTKNGSFRI